MTEIAVVTDRSSDIAPGKARALGIHQVPMTAYVGRGASPLPASATPSSFWCEVEAAGGPVRVAQPTPADFYQTYRSILQQRGCDVTILSIGASGGLSASLNSAHLAAQMLTGARVRVIDSGLIGPPLGQVVAETATVAGDGYSEEEIMDLVYSLLSRIRVLLYAEDLGGLAGVDPGGWWQRLRGAVYGAFEPSLFTLRDGEMVAAGRCGTADDARVRLAEFVGEGQRPGFIGIMSAGGEAGDRELAGRLDPSVEVDEFVMGPVLGAHLGRGSLGVFTIG